MTRPCHVSRWTLALRAATVVVFALLVGPFVVAQAVAAPAKRPIGGVLSHPIDIGSDRHRILRCARRSLQWWNVERGSEHVVVSERGDTPEPVQAPLPFKTSADMISTVGTLEYLAVGDGFWAWRNSGEFGGGLWWVPNGEGERRRLLSLPVHRVARFGPSLVALSGLSHGTTSKGMVWAITHSSDETWVVNEVQPLDGAPELVVDGPTALFVLTERSLWRIDGSSAVNLGRSDFGLLAPKTGVLDGPARLLIGMRYFVGELDFTGPALKEKWYLPLDCASGDAPNADCSCVSIGDR